MFDTQELLEVARQGPPGRDGFSGVTRSVITTSANTIMGDSALVDYIYYVVGNHTMSLPIPNSNRYTVKNKYAASIVINTPGAVLVEGATNVLLGPDSSIDIMSDGTNWFVF